MSVDYLVYDERVDDNLSEVVAKLDKIIELLSPKEPIKQKSRADRAMELLRKIVDDAWCGTIRRDDYVEAKNILSEGE